MSVPIYDLQVGGMTFDEMMLTVDWTWPRMYGKWPKRIESHA